MNKNDRFSLFASPLFIAAVAALLFNDLYLKGAWPGLVSGKLSDVAGLFALPLAVSVLAPRRRLAIHVATGIAFLLWKLPLADGAIAAFNGLGLPFPIGRVPDPTDLVALLIVPVAYRYQPSPWARLDYSSMRWGIALVACLTFCATPAQKVSARHPSPLKRYHFAMSKEKLERAVDSTLVHYPMLNRSKRGTRSRLSIPSEEIVIVDTNGTELFTIDYHGNEEYWAAHPDSSTLDLWFGGIYLPPGLDWEPSPFERARIIEKFEKGFIMKLRELAEPLPDRGDDVRD